MAIDAAVPECMVYFDSDSNPNRCQQARVWQTGTATTYLPEATAVVVGIGGIGGETAKRCHDFGMRVVSVDPRIEPAPRWMFLSKNRYRVTARCWTHRAC